MTDTIITSKKRVTATYNAGDSNNTSLELAIEQADSIVMITITKEQKNPEYRVSVNSVVLSNDEVKKICRILGWDGSPTEEEMDEMASLSGGKQ